MLFLKNGFLEKIETWNVVLSCQYPHFMSFSSKSEHDTVADQATLMVLNRKEVQTCLVLVKCNRLSCVSGFKLRKKLLKK